MSQPCNKNCDIEAPGEVDANLKEFWSGNPWTIFRENNLSCFERNRAYLNVAGQHFIEISHLTKADVDGDSRGAMALDLRRTGQLDLVVRQVGGGPLLIFENRLPPRSYLEVSLRGEKSNRLGIGAKVWAEAGELRLYRELYPANSYATQLPATVHFGLGAAKTVDRLVVRWPSGEQQEFRDVAADRQIVVSEGRSELETVVPGAVLPP